MEKCIVCKFYTAQHDICIYCRYKTKYQDVRTYLIEAIEIVEHEIMDVQEYIEMGKPSIHEDRKSWDAYYDLRYIKWQAIDRRNELIMQLREVCA